MPRKPSVGKSLAEVNPALAKEWHPNKNGDLTPFDFSQGAKIKVWWQCSKNDEHVWEAKINSRSTSKKSGCPFCNGRKVNSSNSLKAHYPHLVSEWHPTKNGDKTPDQFTVSSGHKIWWQCSRNEQHEWESQIKKRSKNGVFYIY